MPIWQRFSVCTFTHSKLLFKLLISEHTYSMKSALMIALCLALVDSAAFSEVVCDPENFTINHINTSQAVLTVTSFDGTFYGECGWKLHLSDDADSYLYLNALLDPKDEIIIRGIEVVSYYQTRLSTIFQSTGTPPQGIISLTGHRAVLVMLNTSWSESERAFYSAFYSGLPVHLHQTEGELTFPLNMNKLLSKKLELQPGLQFGGQVALLNFAQLPTSATSKVTVDGTSLTETSSRIFLQTKPTVTIAYNLTQVEPITFRYWLVSKKCSKQVALKSTDKARPIFSPNSVSRKVRLQSPVRCAMAYSTDADNKFVVHVPSSSGLANAGDSINFIDGNGSIALGLNGPAMKYFSSVDTLIETPSVLVLYESPYASESPNAAYKAPEIKAIPSTQASEIILTKDTPVEVKFSSTEETVHLVISLDKSKHVQIVFPPSVTLKPGDVEIKLFSSDGSSGSVPIATLGQYTRLPAAVVSGGQMLRATFKGKQPSTSFTVTYRLVNANFEARKGKDEKPYPKKLSVLCNVTI